MPIYCSGSWSRFVPKEYIGLGNLCLLQGDFMLHRDILQIRIPTIHQLASLNRRGPHSSTSNWSAWRSWGLGRSGGGLFLLWFNYDFGSEMWKQIWMSQLSGPAVKHLACSLSSYLSPVLLAGAPPASLMFISSTALIHTLGACLRISDSERAPQPGSLLAGNIPVVWIPQQPWFSSCSTDGIRALSIWDETYSVTVLLRDGLYNEAFSPVEFEKSLFCNHLITLQWAFHPKKPRALTDIEYYLFNGLFRE